jgi:hypothetical protein
LKGSAQAKLVKARQEKVMSNKAQKAKEKKMKDQVDRTITLLKSIGCWDDGGVTMMKNLGAKMMGSLAFKMG